MSDTPFFEDVVIGVEIPELEKWPTPRQLVMYAGASGDYNPIHYNNETALSKGLPGIVVHGQLVSACLMQLLTDWLGTAGNLKKYSVSYKAMTFPGEKLLLKGVVSKKSEPGDLSAEGSVAFSIWAENPRGEKSVAGTAVVALPRRASQSGGADRPCSS